MKRGGLGRGGGGGGGVVGGGRWWWKTPLQGLATRVALIAVPFVSSHLS